MAENYDRPVSWGDLLFTVAMALRELERFWPKKYVPGDYDRLKPVAQRVIEHLELCGIDYTEARVYLDKIVTQQRR